VGWVGLDGLLLLMVVVVVVLSMPCHIQNDRVL
jgi:hypothetical protein